MRKILNYLSMFKKRNDGTKHPIQSLTVWGILISVIAPLFSQVIGVDVTTIVELIKNFNVADGKHSIKDWLEIFAQIVGYLMMIKGTFSSDRKPVTFKDNSLVED